MRGCPKLSQYVGNNFSLSTELQVHSGLSYSFIWIVLETLISSSQLDEIQGGSNKDLIKKIKTFKILCTITKHCHMEDVRNIVCLKTKCGKSHFSTSPFYISPGSAKTLWSRGKWPFLISFDFINSSLKVRLHPLLAPVHENGTSPLNSHSYAEDKSY